MAKIWEIKGLYWDEVRNCWIDKNSMGLPLSPQQVKDILGLFQLEAMFKYHPKDILLHVSPESLQFRQKEAHPFTKGGEDDDNSTTYYFWDALEKTWMVDVDPGDDEEHIPNPKPLSSGFMEEFLLGVGAFQLSDFADDEKLLAAILHLPPEKLKKFQYAA